MRVEIIGTLMFGGLALLFWFIGKAYDKESGQRVAAWIAMILFILCALVGWMKD